MRDIRGKFDSTSKEIHATSRQFKLGFLPLKFWMKLKNGKTVVKQKGS